MPSLSVHTVTIDDILGGALAAEHLLELGHTRVAVLSEPSKVSSSQERVRGFRETLIKAGHTLEPNQIRESAADLSSAKKEALLLLGEKDHPTGLFCCNDIQAIGALQSNTVFFFFKRQVSYTSHWNRHSNFHRNEMMARSRCGRVW